MNTRSLLSASFLLLVLAAGCKKSENAVSPTQFDPSIPWQQTNGPHGGIVRCFALSGTNLFAGVVLTTCNGTSWRVSGNQWGDRA